MNRINEMIKTDDIKEEQCVGAIGEEIRKTLWSMADLEYRDFSSKLLPGVTTIMGVRLPALRKIAKSVAKQEQWESYILWDKKQYFEEFMLHGMILGYGKMDFQRLLEHIRGFLPQIDNWSVCDSFCATLKAFAKHREEGWEFLAPLGTSLREYEARFALVMFLDYYVSEPYVDRLLGCAAQLKADGYYAKMAAAWLLAECYIDFPEKVEALLISGILDGFIHNKTISKICDSRVVGAKAKEKLKRLRR